MIIQDLISPQAFAEHEDLCAGFENMWETIGALTGCTLLETIGATESDFANAIEAGDRKAAFSIYSKAREVVGKLCETN